MAPSPRGVPSKTASRNLRSDRFRVRDACRLAFSSAKARSRQPQPAAKKMAARVGRIVHLCRFASRSMLHLAG